AEPPTASDTPSAPAPKQTRRELRPWPSLALELRRALLGPRHDAFECVLRSQAAELRFAFAREDLVEGDAHRLMERALGLGESEERAVGELARDHGGFGVEL